MSAATSVPSSSSTPRTRSSSAVDRGDLGAGPDLDTGIASEPFERARGSCRARPAGTSTRSAPRCAGCTPAWPAPGTARSPSRWRSDRPTARVGRRRSTRRPSGAACGTDRSRSGRTAIATACASDTGPVIAPARNVRSATSQIRRPRASKERHCAPAPAENSSNAAAVSSWSSATVSVGPSLQWYRNCGSSRTRSSSVGRWSNRPGRTARRTGGAA